MERTVGCAPTHVPDDAATPTPAVGVTARLLDRLDHVRRSRGGWRADCPHGHRSAGTLAISEAADGSVLLHCFAGCAPEQVLKAVGLTLADLYPEPLKVVSLSDRRAAQQAHREAAWPAALGVLAREATIALIAARDLAQGRALTPADLARLEDAVRRINHCREVLQ